MVLKRQKIILITFRKPLKINFWWFQTFKKSIFRICENVEKLCFWSFDQIHGNAENCLSLVCRLLLNSSLTTQKATNLQIYIAKWHGSRNRIVFTLKATRPFKSTQWLIRSAKSVQPSPCDMENGLPQSANWPAGTSENRLRHRLRLCLCLGTAAALPLTLHMCCLWLLAALWRRSWLSGSFRLGASLALRGLNSCSWLSHSLRLCRNLGTSTLYRRWRSHFQSVILAPGIPSRRWPNPQNLLHTGIAVGDSENLIHGIVIRSIARAKESHAWRRTHEYKGKW